MELLETTPARLALAAVAIALVAGLLYLSRGRGRRSARSIRVVGIGGGGANAVDAMIRAGLKGVEFVAVNTDLRALSRSSAHAKVAIGRSTTHGLGAGGDVSVGASAAREAGEAIGHALAGSDLVVIVTGLGGGTGSGAAPVVAEIARGQGALTVAVATTPFTFEGSRRARVAQEATAELTRLVDAVATVPNDQVRGAMPSDVTVEDAFRSIDDVLHRSVREIVDLVAVSGRVNLDFADVRAVLRGGGAAAVGFGRAAGENRAVDATRAAIASALLESRLKGASSVLVNVSGSRKLRLAEVDAVVETVLTAAGRDTNLMFGVSLNPRLREEVHVTLIASGSGAATSVPRPAPVSVPTAEPIETGVLDTQALDATSQLEADDATDDWRPVWLRRSTPPNTPAPESSSKHRSQPRGGSSHRARHRRPASPDAE